MLTSGTRAFTHASPTTYKRIVPERGSGFILKRLAEHETEHPHAAHLTKEDVYLGTSWYHRPGFASQLWSWLLEDGLIESDDGMEEYNAPKSPFSSRQLRYARAYGHHEFGRGWTVRYGLTDKGRRIYKEMMDRHMHSFEPKIGKKTILEKLNELESCLNDSERELQEAKELLTEIRNELN